VGTELKEVKIIEMDPQSHKVELFHYWGDPEGGEDT
jgi:hypothetical protein